MLLVEKIISDIEKTKNNVLLEKIRVKYLGKKGYFSSQFLSLRNISCKKERKRKIIKLNKIKSLIKEKIFKKKKELKKKFLVNKINKEKIDVSLPGRRFPIGSFHPITLTIKSIEEFFLNFGFFSFSSKDIEDCYHNFEALNIPKNHPSRTLQDTFWFNKNWLLRTHTSNMQIHIMKKISPPIRALFPGKVYRNDLDATHTPMFHQIEGIIIEKKVNFSNLKGLMSDFITDFFRNSVKIRFRSSYFPFTNPSAEIDILWKKKKWIEVLGCGMIHPNVLKNLNIDSKKYSGLAFGIGVERMTMLRYNIQDLRIFYKNHIKFLSQFR